MGQSWAIDTEMAMGYLSDYLSDIAYLQNGVSAKELYEERKAAQKPTLVYLSETGEIQSSEFTQANIDSRMGQFAHLKLSGAMRMEGGLCSDGISALVNDIQKANANKNISGILLEVNSGGGESTAGQALNLAVKDSTKPVVAFARNAGSAALMGILHSKKIVMAGEQSRIGSIGVFTTYNKKMVEMLKENVGFLYSDTSPDKNAGERQLIATGDTSLLKKSINTADSIFEGEVSKALTLKGDTAMQRDTLNGGFFFAKDGVRRGLAHSIGTFNTAVKALETEVRNANKISTKSKSKDMSFLDDLKSLVAKAEAKDEKAESNATEVSLATVMEKLGEVSEKVASVAAAIEANATDLAGLTETVKNAAQKIEAVEADIQEVKSSVEAVESQQVELEANQLKLEGKVANGKAKPITQNGNGIAEETATEKAFNLKTKSFKAKVPETVN